MIDLTFNDWLSDALLEGALELCIDDPATLSSYVSRFNRDIDSIVKEHGEEPVCKAIWYIYGPVSGYMWEVLDASLGPRRIETMQSLKDLYRRGFAAYCAKYFSHLSRGPEPARPLNTACYMLWDMDGVECPAINGDVDMLDASLDVLSFALDTNNWACQESALHGLGHLAMSHGKQTAPVIQTCLRRRPLPAELRAYAERALRGCVL